MDDAIEPPSTSSKCEVTEYNVPITSDRTAMSPTKLLQHNEHGSLEGSMQVAGQDSGYNSSGSSGNYSPGETRSGGVDEGVLVRTRSRASSHSSISSIPDSTLTNLPDARKPTNSRNSQDYMLQPFEHSGPRAVHTLRQRDVTFRRPSSVRAMQMHTEDEGDDYYHLTPPKRRGSGRTSDISIRSTGSSPFKRSPFYSPTGAAAKTKVKKEYPLVLLHCTLLSPSLPVSGLVGHPDRQKILKEILPPLYWKRWKLLEEKIGSGVLRERGVLISHPEDMYDLLEERLLESLELQHPRLDHGHFLGRAETDSDREDRLAREDSSTEDEEDECPDCGGRFVRQNTTRKWEVRVFAANGLMRAGAWAAAWKEMEKVDVEVGLWLPPDVRALLEKRLAEDSRHSIENGLAISLLQEPENIQVGPPVHTLPPRSPSNAVDLAPQSHVTPTLERPPSPLLPKVTSQDDHRRSPYATKLSDEIDLQTLLVNYIRVLASDPRNIAIVFLSVLVAFVAINSRPAGPASDLRPFPRFTPKYPTLSVVAPQEPATQTWVKNSISATTTPAVPDPTVVPPFIASHGASLGLESSSDGPAEPPAAEREKASAWESDAPLSEESDLVYENGKEVSQEQPTQATKYEPKGSIPSVAGSSSAESIYIASEEKEEPAQYIEDEPSEPLPTASDNLSAESADLDTEEQEQPMQSEETELEGSPLTETNSPSVENVATVSEEQEKPIQSSDDGPEEPLPTLFGAPSANSNDVVFREESLEVQERPTPPSANESQELPPVGTEALSGKDAAVTSKGDEHPFQPREDELEEEVHLLATAETTSLNSNEVMPEEEKPPKISEAAPLEQSLSTAIPLEDIDGEQALLVDAQFDENEEGIQAQYQQNEQHEPSVLDEQNDENKLYDM
ncbi:uncharacterized protein BDV17DRAFT_249268 [Aspergillus undulatus]|uniref:uncharacterized protein n=1 Tax=Aspergillus undulatus TaxID=1810928 RepID=UPI003CCCBC9B